MNTCKTCKYLSDPKCALHEFALSIIGKNIKETKTIIYFDENFGCVNHEPKEEQKMVYQGWALLDGEKIVAKEFTTLEEMVKSNDEVTIAMIKNSLAHESKKQIEPEEETKHHEQKEEQKEEVFNQLCKDCKHWGDIKIGPDTRACKCNPYCTTSNAHCSDFEQKNDIGNPGDCMWVNYDINDRLDKIEKELEELKIKFKKHEHLYCDSDDFSAKTSGPIQDI